MRPKLTLFLSVLLGTLLAGCNPLVMTAVSISPIYDWTDGCTEVQIGGHGFVEPLQAWLGDEELTDIRFPEPDSPDYGFEFWATVPPSTSRSPSTVRLLVYSDDRTSEVPDAFTYVACPGVAYVESAAPAGSNFDGSENPIVEGTPITLDGCGLNSEKYKVRVGTSESLPLSSVCGTANVTFTAPHQDLSRGLSWRIGIFDGDTQIYPDPACDITRSVEEYEPPVDPDTADTAAMEDPCSDSVYITYQADEGGAR